MSNTMLIDATHPEETRVVVVRDKRVEDFDFETASKRPLRGNIYLAKVTRVEPSLQAAFVEYGGNRHGFLAFSEIHPDYYQIPQSDRAALLAEERADVEDEDDLERGKSGRRRRGSRGERTEDVPGGGTAAAEADLESVRGRMGDVPGAASAEAAIGIADDRLPDEDDDSRAPDDDSRAPEEADPTAGARDGVPPPAEGLGAPLDDDGPASLARAIEQVTETIDAEAASDGPTRDAELVDEPSRPAARGEGFEVSAAISDAATGAADPVDVPAPVDPEGGEPAPKPRRRRTTTRTTKTPRTTKKTAEGLVDPQIAEGDAEEDDSNREDGAQTVVSVGGQDALEEIPERRRTPPRRNYKIQEVIKRRQILLVQVVKEERGTKGAALTTYLSLAGRYSVLMPNTDRGGGVSRKITDTTDRRRLKELMEDLEVPEGMGIILRTAGAARTKTEIKRDFEYLLRLWESVRELTLQSIAPKLVYEEGNLVKRAIRDLYSKEIDEILVAGEPAGMEAKDFMRMLMPSHAKNVKLYDEPTPIFTRFGIEPQLDAMFSPQVTLPSKGYIVINPTEALVSIDVNSGRSTKESNIEETAYKTNLEAADEVARQLRLRDLAGLIVIDFIDMDDKRHNRAVEKRLKDALKLDRSRIQVGSISPFGLLEMSRQRIRQGMVETSMVACPSCAGTGHVRSTQSVALHCLRALEEHLLKDGHHHVTVRTTASVALYILNQKRAHLSGLEVRFGLTISINADESIVGQHLEIASGALVERTEDAAPSVPLVSPVAMTVEDEVVDEEAEEVEAVEDTLSEAPRAEAQANDGGSAERGGRRRRRRRRRGGGGVPGGDGEREALSAAALSAESDQRTSDDDEDDEDDDEAEDTDVVEVDAAEANGEDGDAAAEERRSRRRRGRRGGRRHRREGEARLDDGSDGSSDPDGEADDGTDASEDAGVAAAAEVEAASDPAAVGDVKTPDAARASGERLAASASLAGPDEELALEAADDEPRPETVEAEATGGDPSPREAEPVLAQSEAEEAPAPEQKSDPNRSRRVGWWQRRSFF